MTDILNNINGPEDLKNLSRSELKQLAEEIRKEMITIVKETGGHLASSLGVVELTIALHRVFDSPKDKIVWDVGHQSYAHKMLTGRRNRFGTLRQYGGLTGFPDREESLHDAFGAGHASTSVSAALGMATARDLAGEDFHVIAVIGDGSITGGMAFEGLNQAGHPGTNMIVILNDNAMAISPSVGAISRYLSEVRLDPKYARAKDETKRAVSSIPGGKWIQKAIHQFKSGLKDMVLPIPIWDAIGFKYIGPIDGHDIVQIEKALSMASKFYRGPVFIHVVTMKGRGYVPAEENSTKYHGISGEKVEKGSAPSYSKVFGETVREILRENDKTVAITAAMLDGTGLNKAAEEFPKRVFDVGICEQHAVTFAAGLATQGFVPIVAIYSTFLQRAYDQIIHDVCLQNLPVVFALDRAGIVGDDGKTHQGAFDLSYLSCIPNLVVSAPRDESDLRRLLLTAVKSGCPFAIRYPRGSGLGVAQDGVLRELTIGKGELLKDGQDLVIIALGSVVSTAVEAAEVLKEKGVDTAVIDARYAKPLDSDLIMVLANRTKRVVTVEENALAGGFGSLVQGLVSEIQNLRILRIGIPDSFIEHGTQEIIRAKYSLDANGIVEQVESYFRELVKKPTSVEGKL